MRVLHLTSFLQGGAGRAIAALAAAQHRGGHDVVVITSATGAPGYGNYRAHLDALRHAGVTVDEVDSLFTRDDSAHEAVINHVHRRHGGISRFDIVHAHAAVPSAIALRLRERSGVRVPVLQTMHGWGIAKTPEQERADSAVLNAVDRVVVPATSSARLLESIGVAAARIQVVHYGVPPRAGGGAGSDPLYTDIRAWRRDGGAAICCVGTIGERKNQRLLVDALQALGDRRLFAIFVGDGDADGLRGHAGRAGIAPRVRVAGYRDDARGIVAACDVLVLPSLSEGQPLAILEAFCDGVPVVASAIPELQELVDDRVTGWLHDPRSAESLAAVLRQVLAQDAGEQIALIERARAEWRARYSLDRMVDGYAALYAELTGAD
jgi:glycosyltransferase involved in cell wall biosynthesis